MKKIYCILVGMSLCGCAKLNVETAKPIKVDINMRVDIYQHVVNDVESIEGEVFGESTKQYNFNILFPSVYAAEYSPEVESAIERRKQRAAEIESLFAQEYVGENREALLTIREATVPVARKKEVQQIVMQENADRLLIYKMTAQKNNAPLEQVQKVFFQDHYNRAPQGYWFEIQNDSAGGYLWRKK